MTQTELCTINTKYAGGTENICSFKQKENQMFISVKDRGLVNLQAIKQMNMTILELNHGQFKIMMAQNLEEKQMKKNYNQLANDIIELVGTKENIIGLEHCMTRLRFNLHDMKRADTKKIENLKEVIAVKESVGQYQIVIGNEVSEVYDSIVKMIGNETLKKDATKKEKKSFGSVIMDFITSIMLPSMQVMCAGGMIKGINVLCSMLGLYEATSGFYQLMNGVGDAVFYFFPILLGYNTAKKLNMTPFLGLTIGAILCYPSINGVELDIFGTVVNASYTSTFFPVVALVLIAAPLEKFLKKIIPASIRTFIVPTLVLLLVVPVGFIYIGPVANQIGTFVSTIFIKMYDISPVLTGFVLGGTILILIVFGLHTIIGLTNYLNVIQGIPDPIMPLKIYSTFTITAATIAVYLKSKNKDVKEVALPAAISGLLGITEPALYGIAMPNIKIFTISCLGSAIGGVIAALYNMHAYAFTGTGFFSLLGILNPENPQILPIVVGFVVSVSFSFIAAFILYKDKDTLENNTESTHHEDMELLSPIEGNVIDLKESHDQAFYSGEIGDGITIIPDEGLVFAPFDGEVSVLFPTKHAIGLKSNRGIELLIHVGEDTVNLNGEGFTAHVKQGDTIKKGQLLIEFDINSMKEKGFVLETPVIITNEAKSRIVHKQFGHVDALSKVLQLRG